jgi:predicted nucleotidyltransferase
MVNRIAQSAWPTGGTPLFKEVQSPYFLPVTEEILAEIARRIVEKLDPEKIILFGSYAYGDPHQDSDVDLFVVMDSNLSSAHRGVEVCRLIRPRPFPVDIIVRTPAEVSAALAKGDYFIKEILLRGKTLYERPDKSPGLG